MSDYKSCFYTKVLVNDILVRLERILVSDFRGSTVSSDCSIRAFAIRAFRSCRFFVVMGYVQPVPHPPTTAAITNNNNLIR